ncbi:NACHT domain-containing protein [Saccharopolyspora shandongensis]|uniref:NACHT domain-containing protein n=1 Tax=Saccharopolyspora shandongensis TaxID=418495 RepID=UPI00341F7DE7
MIVTRRKKSPRRSARLPAPRRLRSCAGKPLPRPEEFLEDPAGPITGPVPDGWTHHRLDAGHALLRVGGVDELSAGQRPKVRQWLRKLLNRYPQTRLVVTSRPASPDHDGLKRNPSPPPS